MSCYFDIILLPLVVSFMLYPCISCIALLVYLFVLCVACLTGFVIINMYIAIVIVRFRQAVKIGQVYRTLT